MKHDKIAYFIKEYVWPAVISIAMVCIYWIGYAHGIDAGMRIAYNATSEAAIELAMDEDRDEVHDTLLGFGRAITRVRDSK